MSNTVNIAFFGDEGVGKHELVHAIMHKELESLVTDFEENKLEFEIDGQVKEVTLICCETGDDESVQKQNLLLLMRAHVVVLAYGIDSDKSLGSIATNWVMKCREYCPNIPLFLLGCKLDLVKEEPEDVEVNEKQGRDFARIITANAFGQCSAFQGINLLETFVAAVRLGAGTYNKSSSKKKKKDCTIM